MGGMTQTRTGVAMTEHYEEPATRGDLRNALIRIDSKFDSLRTYIDTRFLGLQQQFGKAERLHQIEIVMIVLGFLGIILKSQ